MTSRKYPDNPVGVRFGRLEVLEQVGYDRGEMYWKARCDCGTVALFRRRDLVSGKTRSCGCLRKEKSTERIRYYHDRYYNAKKQIRKQEDQDQGRRD